MSGAEVALARYASQDGSWRVSAASVSMDECSEKVRLFRLARS